MNVNGYEIKDGVLDLSGMPTDTLENKAFLSQRSVKSIILPAGIRYIGDWAFAKCTNLKSVEIACDFRPGVFGKNVFEGCDALESVGFADTDEDTRHLLAVCANKLPFDHLIRSDDIGQKSWYEKWDICLAAKLAGDNAEAGINAALCGEEDISYDGIGSVDGEMPGETDDFIRREEYKKSSLCYLRLMNDRYISDKTKELIRAYITDNRFGTTYGSSFFSIFDEGKDACPLLSIYLDTVQPDRSTLMEMIAATPVDEVYARSYLIRQTGGGNDAVDALML